MYIHIGGENVVSLKDIILIINLNNYGQKDALDKFIAQAKERKRLKGCALEEAKSCIVTAEAVYLSRISSHTLWKRKGFFHFA